MSEVRTGDAFGTALLAYLEHGDAADRDDVIERDDGYIEWHRAAQYFGPGTETERDHWAISHVRGRTLDIGAGAGRHALALQESGHDVVALDVSPGCIEVCRRRGVRQVFHGTVDRLAQTDPAPFDTFVMLGNNLGLLGGREQTPVVLRALASMARPGARLIGTGLDPSQTDDPVHLGYHQANRERGRMIGHVVIRCRYRDLADPWFDYCHASLPEVDGLMADAGWRHVADDGGSPMYAAIWELAVR
jgi:SAM-dependent methyltransferase